MILGNQKKTALELLKEGRDIKIPVEIKKNENIVLISQKKYENFLKLLEQRKWEEEDTDEAIKIFKKEKKAGKLFKINSFFDIR